MVGYLLVGYLSVNGFFVGFDSFFTVNCECWPTTGPCASSPQSSPGSTATAVDTWRIRACLVRLQVSLKKCGVTEQQLRNRVAQLEAEVAGVVKRAGQIQANLTITNASEENINLRQDGVRTKYEHLLNTYAD